MKRKFETFLVAVGIIFVVCFFAIMNSGMQGTDTESTIKQEQSVKIDGLTVFPHFPEKEVKKIFDAAQRNDMPKDLIPILFAIRKAENGGPGLEFGIMCEEHKNTDFDQQAGCCAVTIINNYSRWIKTDRRKDFITFLGGNYCPTEGEDLTEAEKELNKYWIPNVKEWVKKVEGLYGYE